jgi:hypothetical protein
MNRPWHLHCIDSHQIRSVVSNVVGSLCEFSIAEKIYNSVVYAQKGLATKYSKTERIVLQMENECSADYC